MANIFRDSGVAELIPLAKVRDALNKDPKIEIFYETLARYKENQGYNALITIKAHRERRVEKLQQFFDYSNESDYDKISGLAVPPQLVIRDTLRQTGGLEDNVILLHLGLISEREIHLQEIVLQNPYAPITKPLLPFQRYPSMGHGIFDKTLSNLEQYAKAHGIEEITAMAAHELQRDIFLRRGYEVDEREQQLIMMAEMMGMSWPIVKRL